MNMTTHSNHTVGTLMVINMSPEFGLIMHSKAGTFAYGELPDIVEDCSDVLLKIKNPNGDGYIMQHAHNEDGMVNYIHIYTN